MAIAKTIGDRQLEAQSLVNLGNAYDSLGEYKRAIDYHNQGLAIAKTIGDRQLEARSLNNLGIAYKELGEYKRAIDYYNQGLAIAKTIGDRQLEAQSLVNLGIAYKELGEYSCTAATRLLAGSANGSEHDCQAIKYSTTDWESSNFGGC